MLSSLRVNFRSTSCSIFRPFSVKNVTETISTEAKNSTKKVANEKLVMVKKNDISQSPLKMKFLVRLVRDAWMPDALAQMKFSPKHRAEDIAKLLKVCTDSHCTDFYLIMCLFFFLQRSCALARLNYEALPEELYVKEVLTNKGTSHKKLRIMGKGRTGVGYIRSTHVWIKVGVVDFEKEIANAKTFHEKNKWLARRQVAEKVRSENSGIAFTPSS